MEIAWSQVKNALEAKMAQSAYKLWIHPVQCLTASDGVVCLGCPNKFSVSWIRENYLSLLLEELRKAASRPVEVRFELVKVEDPVAPDTAPKAAQLNLPAMYEPVRPALRLNPAFTFEHFVTGENNHLAFSTAWNLSRGPGRSSNFLFYLSEPGLGKSHLCQAIGRDILEREPKQRLMYLTVEDFVNDMVHSLKEKKMGSFKEKYRNGCDVLLLEEVHLLSGKEKTQDELGFALDSMLSMNKKVVMTSAKLPRDIRNIRSSLRSRLNSGLIVQIDPPDFETRVRILRKKAEWFNILAPKNVIEFLAEHLQSDVRQLESSLLSLKAISSTDSTTINLDLARKVIGRFVRHKKSLNVETIQQLVADQFRLTVEEMRSKTRQSRVVLPRSIAMHLCRRYTDRTLEAIGKAFERNHPSVLYAIKSLEAKRRKSLQTNEQVKLLENKIERMLFMEPTLPA